MINRDMCHSQLMMLADRISSTVGMDLTQFWLPGGYWILSRIEGNIEGHQNTSRHVDETWLEFPMQYVIVLTTFALTRNTPVKNVQINNLTLVKYLNRLFEGLLIFERKKFLTSLLLHCKRHYTLRKIYFVLYIFLGNFVSCN